MIALCGLGLAALAQASESGTEVSAEDVKSIFDGFSHEEHGETFEEDRIACAACHVVGARVVDEEGEVVPFGAVQLTELFVAPPPTACHHCHKPEPGRRASGPQGCQVCHGEGFEPESHGLGWLDMHGEEVRLLQRVCRDCHQITTCLACHEQRGALAGSPHGPAWGAVHGVEARFDPHSCVTCHAGDSCTSCHDRGVNPW